MRKRPTYEELAATTLNKVQLGTPTLPYVPPNNAEFALMQLKGLSEDIRLRELSVQALRRDSEQVAAQTGLPPEVIQRLVGASEASVAVSREMQQQQQHAQSANQRQQQLQTEAILTQLGTAAAAQQQQNSMLQQLSSSLANAAPGAPQPATPPAIDTQQLATFLGGAISGTAREVGHQMAARFRELLQEAAMGNQAISQQMFQPIMTYIENLPQQNQILQYFDNRSQFVTVYLNHVMLNTSVGAGKLEHRRTTADSAKRGPTGGERTECAGHTPTEGECEQWGSVWSGGQCGLRVAERWDLGSTTPTPPLITGTNIDGRLLVAPLNLKLYRMDTFDLKGSGTWNSKR